jgi:hypothetical protein
LVRSLRALPRIGDCLCVPVSLSLAAPAGVGPAPRFFLTLSREVTEIASETVAAALLFSFRSCGAFRFPSRNCSRVFLYNVCLVQLHEQIHNFNNQTANSLPNSLPSFSENSLS